MQQRPPTRRGFSFHATRPSSGDKLNEESAGVHSPSRPHFLGDNLPKKSCFFLKIRYTSLILVWIVDQMVVF